VQLETLGVNFRLSEDAPRDRVFSCPHERRDRPTVPELTSTDLLTTEKTQQNPTVH
jgi:hypothetical protein